jgi:hypothetical protein
LPRIFDNIESSLLPALRETLSISARGDFCVGYFNLRGWKSIDDLIANWSGKESHQCRLLVGMQRLPQDELRIGLGNASGDESLDNQSAARLKRKLAEDFRLQLMLGMPASFRAVEIGQSGRQAVLEAPAAREVVSSFPT